MIPDGSLGTALAPLVSIDEECPRCAAPNLAVFEGRLVGAISAALILGAKLQETNGT